MMTYVALWNFGGLDRIKMKNGRLLEIETQGQDILSHP